jgi:parallel beta-helix repeat protein
LQSFLISALVAFVVVSSAPFLIGRGIESDVSKTMSMATHDSISIVGDAEFASLATSEGWPGDGTPSDPYMIEGLEISTADPYALSIADTSASFVVTGCSLVGASGSVMLQNVLDGVVHGNALTGAGYAVVLAHSPGNAVTNNTCAVSGYAVSAWESDDIVLANNTISSSIGMGVEIIDCSNVTLSANAMTGCGVMLHPWLLEHANTHTITPDNTVDGKPVYYMADQAGAAVPADAGQVILANCSDMSVEGMSFSGVTVGVEVLFCSNITLSCIESTGNFWCGADIEMSEGVAVEGCDLSSNHNNGLRLYSCEGTAVSGCTVSYNHMGIIVSFSGSTNLAENECSYNDYGIFIDDSTACNLSSNALVECDVTIIGYSLEEWNTHVFDDGNTVNGKLVVYVKDQSGGSVPDGAGELILANCSDMVVEGHTFDSDGQTALLMGHCSNLTFSGCMFQDNARGIFMQRCSGNAVVYSSFIDSGLGVYAQYCTGNTFLCDSFVGGSVGIQLDNDSSGNEVRMNSFADNSEYAVMAQRQSTGNVLHNNSFNGNNGASSSYSSAHAQCYDDCTGNEWSLGGLGNYWSDWTSPDDDGDGIVDEPYGLAPTGNAYDDYPLTSAPEPEPSSGEEDVAVSVLLEGTVFRADEEVCFLVEVANTGDGTVQLVTMDSQLVDFQVEDQLGSVVFSYSPYVLFVITTWTIGPGESISQEMAWDASAELPHEPGEYTIHAFVNGHNDLNATATVAVDGDEPVTESAIEGQEGEDGWFTSPVNVTLSSKDATSGVAGIQYRVDGSEWADYTGTFEVSGDGTHTLEYYATDLAGNAEDAVAEEVRIDCSAPAIEIDVPDGTVFNTSAVDISVSCSDACSGVVCSEYSLDGAAYVDCTNASGIGLEGLVTGTHVMMVRAYDAAGNWAAEEATFEVLISADDSSDDEVPDDEAAEDEGAWPLVAAAGVAAAAVAVGAAAFWTFTGRRPKA